MQLASTQEKTTSLHQLHFSAAPPNQLQKNMELINLLANYMTPTLKNVELGGNIIVPCKLVPHVSLSAFPSSLPPFCSRSPAPTQPHVQLLSRSLPRTTTEHMDGHPQNPPLSICINVSNAKGEVFRLSAMPCTQRNSTTMVLARLC